MSDPVLDCDVHVAVPSREALYPYLSEHWRKYMLATDFKGSGAVHNTHPAWLPMLATPAVTLEQVQQAVLERASLAILHAYYGAESYTHPYLASALATAVNRWVQEQWLDRDDRLCAAATIAPNHTTQAVTEIERVTADHRFLQVAVPARSAEPYGNERFWPIWEAAADAGLVVGIHYSGAAAMHPQTFVGWVDTTFESYANLSNAFQAQIVSLVFSGIFERCPDLRFAITESGWTWLPAVMWKMDQEWKAFRREVPWISEPPSAYVRRHFRFVTAPADLPPTDAELADVVRQLGSDELLMYGSDFPHVHEAGAAERLLGVLDAEQARRMLWSNARECYTRLDALPVTVLA